MKSSRLSFSGLSRSSKVFMSGDGGHNFRATFHDLF